MLVSEQLNTCLSLDGMVVFGSFQARCMHKLARERRKSFVMDGAGEQHTSKLNWTNTKHGQPGLGKMYFSFAVPRCSPALRFDDCSFLPGSWWAGFTSEGSRSSWSPGDFRALWSTWPRSWTFQQQTSLPTGWSFTLMVRLPSYLFYLLINATFLFQTVRYWATDTVQCIWPC